MTMIFTIQKARELAKHYQFLVGMEMTDKIKITHVVYAPEDSKQFTVFYKAFFDTYDNEKALNISGFDAFKMKVLLTNFDSWGGNIFYNELDQYLTKNNIKKEY